MYWKAQVASTSEIRFTALFLLKVPYKMRAERDVAGAVALLLSTGVTVVNNLQE